MRGFIHNVLSVLGALAFLCSVGMLVVRPAPVASALPERREPEAVLEEPSEPVREVEDPTVWLVLDAGHGGIDGGTNHMNLLEKNLSLRVVRMVKERIEAADLENLKITLTRDEDVFLSLHQRVAAANRYPRSYFVSIHFNGSEHRSASGTETFFVEPKPRVIQNQLRKRMGLPAGVPLRDQGGRRFAEMVQRSLVNKIRTRDRKIQNNPQFILPREVIGPAILVECVFISNPKEARRLQSDAFVRDIAQGISEGILNYLDETQLDPFAGISVLETQEPPVVTMPDAG